MATGVELLFPGRRVAGQGGPPPSLLTVSDSKRLSSPRSLSEHVTHQPGLTFRSTLHLCLALLNFNHHGRTRGLVLTFPTCL